MQANYLKNLQKQLKQQDKEKKGVMDEIPVNMNHVVRDEMLKAQEEGKVNPYNLDILFHILTLSDLGICFWNWN